jgi:hypothetical protein
MKGHRISLREKFAGILNRREQAPEISLDKFCAVADALMAKKP